MKYSLERKQAVIAKMLPPHNISLAKLALQEQISVPTLYLWRQEARQSGRLLPDSDSNSQSWTSADKFSAVLETASLNQLELSEYCRKRGIYPEQIKQWRTACEQANDWDRSQNDRLKSARKADELRLRDLERELLRKDRALAETAALLVLRKKALAIWGESAGE